MLVVYHTQIKSQLPEVSLAAYLDRLPPEQQKTIRTFYRWQDAHASLFGKLLLLKAWEEAGLTAASLGRLRYSEFERPYLPGEKTDFNISHSGQYVVCGLSDQGNVGIDVEQVKPVEVKAFREQWTDREWQEITSAKDPLRQFFTFWTQKEAIIKADGQGLSIPLAEIELLGDRVNCQGNTWYLKEIPVADDCIVHLATKQIVDEVVVKEVDFY